MPLRDLSTANSSLLKRRMLHRSARWPNVLVVEENAHIASQLRDHLHRQSIAVRVAYDVAQATEFARADPGPDVILISISPDREGNTAALDALCAAAPDARVLFMVTLGQSLSPSDRNPANTAHPFSIEELVRRIYAALPPTAESSSGRIVTIGKSTINFATQEGHRNGSTFRFTSLELDILRYLLTREGEIILRKELLRDVWALPQTVVTRTVDRHIASLRRKLEDDPARPVFIETIYGKGYRFSRDPLPES